MSKVPKHSIAAFLLLSLLSCYQPEAYSIGSIANASAGIFEIGKAAVTGIISELPNLIPTPEKIVQLSKQALLGLPFEVILSAVDKVCSIATAANNVSAEEPASERPEIQNMSYVLFTDTDNVSVPILQPSELWKNEKFDTGKKVVILVTGWGSSIDEKNDAAGVLSEAYKARGDTNFILIDTAKFVDTLYTWSAFNTRILGAELGKGLTELVKDVPLENIHLMGHSLGAHIVGSAGKTFQQLTRKLLPRITGFDPAKPCFNEGESLQGLGRGDAEFVDVIHSDSGGLGKSEALGDADFFPNGIVPLMPGCLDISCSHARSWQYYAESVMPGNENNFIAKKCGSLLSYEINACNAQEVPMGYACPKSTKGNFFLKTSEKSPYGLGNGGNTTTTTSTTSTTSTISETLTTSTTESR